MAEALRHRLAAGIDLDRLTDKTKGEDREFGPINADVTGFGKCRHCL
jgi:hypothetical protein